MWKTVLLLIVTLFIIPVLTVYYDEPISVEQWSILKPLFIACGAAALFAFIVSTITKNYSQVDKLWSVIPIVYVWMVVYMVGYEKRIFLMAVLVTIWGLRLSYNFYRRGGYKWKFWEGEEDYRWSVLRAKPEFQPEWKWTLFNFFFISFYQMFLILLFTLPIVKCVGSGPLTFWDALVTVLFLGFVIIEAIADQQQYDYQTIKYDLINTKQPLVPPYSKGFIDSGLWGKVRHPNYASEQAIWVVFYLFSIIATGHVFNWSIAGCILLILLFKGSADFSEAISVSKYPEYKEYIKRVPRFIPKLF